MKALMIAAALSLGACAPQGAPSAPVAAPAAQGVLLAGTKALYIAELAYNSVASATNALGKACLAAPKLPCPISNADAAKLRALNRTATMALVRGKAAQGDAAKAVEASAVFVVVDQIKALTGL